MTDEEQEAVGDLVRTRAGTDRFGVPHTLMGVHDEDFFAVLGRIVPLCALLENHLLAVCQGLTGSGQHEHPRRPASELIKVSEHELVTLTDETDRELVVGFPEVRHQADGTTERLRPQPLAGAGRREAVRMAALPRPERPCGDDAGDKPQMK